MKANRTHRFAFARSLSQIHQADLPQNQPPTPHNAIATESAEFDRCRPNPNGGRETSTRRFTVSADMPELPFAHRRDGSNKNVRRRATTHEAIRPAPGLSEDEKESEEDRHDMIQRLQTFMFAADDGDCDRPANGVRESSEPSRPQHHAPPRPNAAGLAADDGHLGFRPDYKLGDTLRSPVDMVVQPSREAQFIAVRSLSRHDFAFVRRSDGSFSYAILAFSKNASADESKEEALVFVLCEEGSTKSVKRKYWNDSIRLVNTHGLGGVAGHPSNPHGVVVSRSHSPTSVRDHVDHEAYCREGEQLQHLDQQGRPLYTCSLKEMRPLPFSRGDLDAFPGAEERDLSCPPSEIRFVNGLEEEYSVISSVSQRARMR